MLLEPCRVPCRSGPFDGESQAQILPAILVGDQRSRRSDETELRLTVARLDLRLLVGEAKGLVRRNTKFPPSATGDAKKTDFPLVAAACSVP